MANFLTYNGETHSIGDWADILGIRHDAMDSRYRRFKKGKCGEDKLFQQGSGAKNICLRLEYNGITDTVEGWARRIGVLPSTIHTRVKSWKKKRIEYGQIFHIGKVEYKDRKRANVFSYKGEELTLTEWSRKLGISFHTMKYRLREFVQGKMSARKCFTHGKMSPSRVKIPLKVGNKVKKFTISGLARRLGVSVSTISSRRQMIRKKEMDKNRLFIKGNIKQKDRLFVENKRYSLDDGTKVSIMEIAKLAGVSIDTIQSKLKKGSSIQDVWNWATQPYRHVKGAYWIEGTKISSRKIAEELQIKQTSLSDRIRNGWDLEDALSETRVSHEEAYKRTQLSRKRNKRRNELRKMGLII